MYSHLKIRLTYAHLDPGQIFGVLISPSMCQSTIERDRDTIPGHSRLAPNHATYYLDGL